MKKIPQHTTFLPPLALLVAVTTLLLVECAADEGGAVVSSPEEVRTQLMACSRKLRESCADATALAGVTETEIFSAQLDNFTEAGYNASCGGMCAAAWESYFICAKELLMGLPADLYHNFDMLDRNEEEYLVRMSIMCKCGFPFTEECLSQETAKQLLASSSGTLLRPKQATWSFIIASASIGCFTLLASAVATPS